jgi:hypothetical protein
VLDQLPLATAQVGAPRSAGPGGFIASRRREAGLFCSILARSPDTRVGAGTRVEAGTVGQLDIGCTVLVAVTVDSHEQLDDHTAHFEQDASGLVDIVRAGRQDRAVVAACLPVGIVPGDLGGAAR